MAGILNIQLKSLLGDKETNLKKVEHYIKFNKDKKLDLVIMPEFFTTSIAYKDTPEDENGGDVIKTMQRLLSLPFTLTEDEAGRIVSNTVGTKKHEVNRPLILAAGAKFYQMFPSIGDYILSEFIKM